MYLVLMTTAGLKSKLLKLNPKELPLSPRPEPRFSQQHGSLEMKAIMAFLVNIWIGIMKIFF